VHFEVAEFMRNAKASAARFRHGGCDGYDSPPPDQRQPRFSASQRSVLDERTPFPRNQLKESQVLWSGNAYFVQDPLSGSKRVCHA
jgi:hypothetical protein